MLQKLMLAVTMTFTLSLFSQIHLPANNQTATKVYLAEIPTLVLSKISILDAE